MIRAHIIFTGTVQGVGFRFTVQKSALTLGLEGWVKNLPNGAVEVVIEGAKEVIEKLCQNIDDSFDGKIQNRNIQFVPALNEFKDFQIVY